MLRGNDLRNSLDDGAAHPVANFDRHGNVFVSFMAVPMLATIKIDVALERAHNSLRLRDQDVAARLLRRRRRNAILG